MHQQWTPGILRSLAVAPLALLLTGLAVATEPPDPDAAKPDRGEYVRLSQEIEKLAQKNAWSGVVRLWPELIATGVPLELEDLLAGAHASRAVGDVRSSRERLDKARTLVEDSATEREIIEWMSDIDTNYGSVSIKCDKPKVPADLQPVAMPFNPNMQRAIEHARERVAEECTFEGMLPHGEYVLVVADDREEVKVAPQLSSVNIDLRRHDKKRRR